MDRSRQPVSGSEWRFWNQLSLWTAPTKSDVLLLTYLTEAKWCWTVKLAANRIGSLIRNHHFHQWCKFNHNWDRKKNLLRKWYASIESIRNMNWLNKWNVQIGIFGVHFLFNTFNRYIMKTVDVYLKIFYNDFHSTLTSFINNLDEWCLLFGTKVSS